MPPKKASVKGASVKGAKRSPKKEIELDEVDEVDELVKSFKNARLNETDLAQTLINKWVQAITTHMKRSRNTILRKEIAPWFEDVISTQGDALAGCYRLKSTKQKTSPPVVPSALRAALGKNTDKISKPDLCAAIVLFYIRGWLYARPVDDSKRDYKLLMGQTKKTTDFLTTMSNWVQDVNLKLTRHIKEAEQPVEAEVPIPEQTPPLPIDLVVAGGPPRRQAAVRDVRKRLRQNIFVPENDITQTEVYYPNSIINDIPNCFAPKDTRVFGTKAIPDADEKLQKLHASVLGVPKQYAAKHDYPTNISYPSELVEELFPLTLDEFESPCAVVMLWNFYQLVKKPPDRRKILLPLGLNRQEAPEDYHTLVRPERAALLIRQAIMFYTSGYCMIQSGLALQQSPTRLVPPNRRFAGIKMAERDKPKNISKKGEEPALKMDTARHFAVQQNKDLKELTDEFDLTKERANAFQRMFELQKKIISEAKKQQPELDSLVKKLYAVERVAYGDNVIYLTPAAQFIASLKDARSTARVIDILNTQEAELIKKLQAKSTNTLNEATQILAEQKEALRVMIVPLQKTQTFKRLTQAERDELLADEDLMVEYARRSGRLRDLDKLLQEIQTHSDIIRVQELQSELFTKRNEQLATRVSPRPQRKKTKVKKESNKKANKKANKQEFKGVVTGPSLIVRGFSRVFNLTNSQTIDDRKDPTQDAVMRAIQRCAIFRTPSALKVLGVDRSEVAGPALPCDIMMDKTSAASALLLAFMELADYMYSPSPPLITRTQLRTVDGYYGNTPFGQGESYDRWSENHKQAFRAAYRAQMKKWMNVGFQPTGERDKKHGMPLMNWDTWASDTEKVPNPNARLVPNPWRVREDNYCRMLLTEFPPGMRNRLGIGSQAKKIWSTEMMYGSKMATIAPICVRDPGLYEEGSRLDAKTIKAGVEGNALQSKRATMQQRVGDAMADIAVHFRDEIEPQFGVYYYKTAFPVQPTNAEGTGIEVNQACKMWGDLKQPLATVKPPALLNLGHHPLTDVPVKPSMFKPLVNMPDEWFVYPLNRFDAGLLNGQQFRSGVSATPRGTDGGLLEDYDITLRKPPKFWDLTVALKKLVGEDFSCKNAVEE
jgi:hypothetical protein